jgi:hypothetical protein
MSPNHYETLAVSTHASAEEIRAAYKSLAKKLHPDVSPGSEESFKAITRAYQVLNDPEERLVYDEYLHGFHDEGHVHAARDLEDLPGTHRVSFTVPFTLTPSPAGEGAGGEVKRGWFRRLFALFLLALILPALLSAEPRPLTQRQRQLLVLDRLTWGPDWQDLADIQKLGIQPWIRRQLHPAAIPDTACDKKLADIHVFTEDPQQLYDDYPQATKVVKPLAQDKPREVLIGLWQAKLDRLVFSRRQLQEVMVDFWFNHFNIYWPKNLDKWLVPQFEAQAIRPHALGRFRDLLGAVAKSPAMMAYLDNAESVVDMRYAPEDQKKEIENYLKKNPQAKKSGLNENYARELMELHTLGVDGGYTQKDVVEAARVLTGWTLVRPQGPRELPDLGADGKPIPSPQPLSFVFRAKVHDRGPKTILGQAFPAGGGMEEGEHLLDLLAKHPSTAHFIAFKLCRHFVADEPPEALVKKVAARFLASDGDIRACLQTLFASPEFFDPANRRSKMRTPL